MKVAFLLLLLPTLIFANVTEAVNIITSDFKEATVIGGYGNNLVIVRDADWNNLTYSEDQIAATKGCVGAICVGDKGLNYSFEKLVVRAIFPSGKMVVSNVDTYAFKAIWPEDLAITTGCTFKFCIGDKVAFAKSTDYKTFKVIGFFANKTLIVKDRLGAMVVNERDLVRKEDICK